MGDKGIATAATVVGGDPARGTGAAAASAGFPRAPRAAARADRRGAGACAAQHSIVIGGCIVGGTRSHHAHTHAHAHCTTSHFHFHGREE